MKIVLMESLGISEETLKAKMAPFEAAGHTFAVYEKTTDVETLIEEAKDADAMILANMPMPAAVIEACPNLKFIDIAFTGVDHVAVDAAKAKGIKLSNASGYSAEAVPELAVGMALSLLRNMREVEARCRAGETKAGLVGSELKGKTVGIIGLGKIGMRSAQIFHIFGTSILATSRTIHKNVKDYVLQVGLDELLKNSDIVVLHCPLTAETKGMINKEKLALMKPSAILLNLARGPVVVSEDLAEALKNGTIAAAGIDVFDVEPPLPEDEPLLGAPNTLLTPHVAFATKESMLLRADIVFDNLQAFLEGRQNNIV